MAAGDLYLTVTVNQDQVPQPPGATAEQPERSGEFGYAIVDLQDHLPRWWRTDDPASELYKVLSAFAAQIDGLSDFFDSVYLDSSVTTATDRGLRRIYAFAYGVQQEQLPQTVEALRGYIQARAAEDGSTASLIATLMALLNTPVNIQPGSPVMFPASGGLTFPASNQGITLWQYDSHNLPSPGLVFAADGSGLRFPTDPQTIPGEAVIVADGTTPIGSGPGLVFATNGFISIIEDFAHFAFTVRVKSYLAFDRAAFARAIERFRPAHLLPARIVEVNS